MTATVTPHPPPLTPQGSTFVRGLTEIDVDQLDEILDIIAAGVALRTTKETNLNQASSRSHTVFTITGEGRGVHEHGGRWGQSGDDLWHCAAVVGATQQQPRSL